MGLVEMGIACNDYKIKVSFSLGDFFIAFTDFAGTGGVWFE